MDLIERIANNWGGKYFKISLETKDGLDDFWNLLLEEKSAQPNALAVLQGYARDYDMSSVTHLFISWSVVNISRLNQRERALITIAGVIPDVDGLGIVADFLTRNSTHPLEWWGRFHHVLAHNLGFGILVAFTIFLLATRRWVTASMAFLSFHLHIVGDIVGARGPEGYQWPIFYLLPFSNVWQFTWKGQWALNAWPNFVITGVAIALTFYLAWKRGFSPLEIVSSKADRAFIRALRKRFGAPV